MTNQSTLLSDAVIQEIEVWLKKFPAEQRQSAVIAALAAAQKANGGWLSQALMDAVADYLGMPKIAVYEVASFYSMFELKPVGRTRISVCTNVSCMLRGSDQVVAHLKKRLGVNLGESTADGKFYLKEVECLAACGGAPCMIVDETYHENLTPEKIDAALDAVKG